MGLARARPRLLLAGCVLVALGAFAYRRFTREVRPNVVFVLIDTLRADRLGEYGRTRRLAPFLDTLAGGSLVFERAYSASSWTVPAVVSLFLGQRPFTHGVTDFLLPLPQASVTLAQVLKAHGYDTAAFLASTVMADPFGLYKRGFAEYRLVGNQYAGIDAVADASQVNAAALVWFDRRTAPDPFFLYLHYMEPHWPYEAHDGITDTRSKVATPDETLGFRAVNGNHMTDAEARARAWSFSEAERTRLRDLYDGEVRYLDRRLAELFEALGRLGALENTIVVVTSDHGEELGEHGLYGHGASLYEPEIHVPLIVHLPGGAPARITRPVETAGLAAALVQAVGIKRPATFQVDAVALRADASAPGALPSPVSQLTKIANFGLWLHRTAVLQDDRKLLIRNDGTVDAYDLRADAGELSRLTATSDEVARAHELDAYVPFAARGVTPPVIDDDARARLRALGYVGTP